MPHDGLVGVVRILGSAGSCFDMAQHQNWVQKKMASSMISISPFQTNEVSHCVAIPHLTLIFQLHLQFPSQAHQTPLRGSSLEDGAARWGHMGLTNVGMGQTHAKSEGVRGISCFLGHVCWLWTFFFVGGPKITTLMHINSFWVPSRKHHEHGFHAGCFTFDF